MRFILSLWNIYYYLQFKSNIIEQIKKQSSKNFENCLSVLFYRNIITNNQLKLFFQNPLFFSEKNNIFRPSCIPIKCIASQTRVVDLGMYYSSEVIVYIRLDLSSIIFFYFGC